MKKWLGAFLALLAIAGCVYGSFSPAEDRSTQYSVSGSEGHFTKPKLPEGAIHLNEADWEELITLPGIGDTLAQAILAEREAHGDFYYPEDLMAVKGIGTIKLAQIREMMHFLPGNRRAVDPE